MIAKPISIKLTGGKSGGCAAKAVELTSGDLPFVPESGLRVEQFILTGRLADSPGLHFSLPNAYFDSLGLPRLTGGR
jgi:hypothetical protein